MKKFRKLLLILVPITLIVLAAVSFAVYLFFFNPKSSSRKNEATKTALERANLESLPESAQNIDVSIDRNIFTRSFKVSFEAPKNVVNSWLEKSDELSNPETEKLDENKICSQSKNMYPKG